VVKRPDNSDYLGLKSFNEQKVPEARQYLEKAIQQYPNSDVINFYLGYIYYAYQDRQNASLYLTRAAQINPDFAQQANQILSSMK
jgi:predicted Zn-dependent protease